MRTPSKRTIRVVAVTVLVLGSAVVAGSLLAGGTATPGGSTPTPSATATADGTASGTPLPNGSTPTATNGRTPGAEIGIEDDINRSNVSTATIPPGAEVTVVATQGFFVSDENAELVAFTRSGRVVYHNSSYRVYFDVDPVPGTRYTVEYVASKQLPNCQQFESYWCTNNVVERVNLSTGAVTRVWEKKTARVHSTRYHDVDRLNETHLVVAGIHEDRVFVVDTRDGDVEWTWNASTIYDASQGGKSGDWTHINDVEVLPDGRIMVSVRNMDQVVFLEPGGGVQESWSLGAEDDHAVLYEQHNPDYIPASRGGPAVVVGDSENNRVIEYRRVDGEWTATWIWRDLRMQWPRDADRLPNGNTLVVDSHGDRVLEVDPSGEVVWSVEIGMPYDAERLGTGDESAGGPALPRPKDGADGNGTGTGTGPVGGDPSTVPWHTQILLVFKDLLPSLWVNSLLYVAPEGIQFTELVVIFGVTVNVGAWGALEFHWSRYSVRSAASRVRAGLERVLG